MTTKYSYPSNREKSMVPKSGLHWCMSCDLALVGRCSVVTRQILKSVRI